MPMPAHPPRNPESPFASLGWHHVGIRVPDYEVAKAWYIDKLDFRVLQEWPCGNLMLAYLCPPNDDEFHLELLGGAIAYPKPVLDDLAKSLEYGGYQHVCLHVDSVEAARVELELRGGPPFYDVYATADGEYMAVGSYAPQFWRRLLDVLGLEGLPDQWDRAAWPRTKAAIAAAFATRTRTRAESTALFDQADVCVTPVLSMAEEPDARAARHPARGRARNTRPEDRLPRMKDLGAVVRRRLRRGADRCRGRRLPHRDG